MQGHELLDETDFLLWVKKIQELRPEEPVDDETAKNIMAAFRVFDLDNDGYITRNELRKAMDMIGEPVTEEQLNEFMKMADVDKNGKIDYEGWCYDSVGGHAKFKRLFCFQNLQDCSCELPKCPDENTSPI